MDATAVAINGIETPYQEQLLPMIRPRFEHHMYRSSLYHEPAGFRRIFVLKFVK
jgi:hypothetical protein